MQRSALGALVIGAALILTSYASAWAPAAVPLWGAWAMVIGSAATLAGMLALGMLRSGHSPVRTAAASCALLGIIVAGFGVPLMLAADAAGDPLWLGLPRRVAIELYGVGLLPALIFPALFARGFQSAALTDEALTALRRDCAALRAHERT